MSLSEDEYEEIKQMIKDEVETKKTEFKNTRRRTILEDLIEDIQRIEDQDWVNSEIKNLLQYCFTDIEWKEEDAYILLNYKKHIFSDIRDKDLREEIIGRYSQGFSKEQLKLIEIENDPMYIYKKSQNYQGLKIGIDPRIKIGLEVEANNSGLNGDILGISSQQKIGNYRSDLEATVPNGMEIKTPIIHDNPDELSVFATVLDALKDVGCYTDKKSLNTAGQINIGLDYLDSASSIIQFFELYGNAEELLFHISNPEGEMMRQSVYNNSRFKPISGAIGSQTIPEDISRADIIKMFQPDNKESLPGLMFKKNSICLRGENNRDYRLEYRISNGTVDYITWIDNIRLIGKMVEVSKELGDIVDGKIEPTEKQIEKLSLKESLKDQRISLEEKLYVLMDILFEDDKTKQIYTNRFYALENEIARDKDKGKEIYEKPCYSSDSSFGVVDFQRQYISSLEAQNGLLVYTDDGYEPEMINDIERK